MQKGGPGLLSLREKMWISSVGILGAVIIAVSFPWVKIGRFSFRILDYFVNREEFINGVRWFSGYGTPQESATTTVYLLFLSLLLIQLVLLIVSLTGYGMAKGWAPRVAGVGVKLSALIPAAFILSILVINGTAETAEMTLFPYFALAAAVIPAVLLILFTRFPEKRLVKRFNREKTLWLICGIALVWLFIFAYIPMAGIVTAFFNYRPGMSFAEMPFVGLKYFRDFFALPDFMKILRNTLVISGLGLTIGFVAPIIFALLLSELTSKRFKRTVQTISYMPYFVSWVVVASIMTSLLNSNGLINELLLNWGVIEKPISYLSNPNLFWWIQLAANIWKNIGWGSIIYLAAIAGVDQELYQAGAVDGLGRFGRAWHITLPGIRTTIVLLFILGIGGLFNTGFEYQLLLGTPMTTDVHEVVDTYVYRYGIQQGRYSFAVAVGLMKSIFGFTLVIVSNQIAKKVSDISIL